MSQEKTSESLHFLLFAPGQLRHREDYPEQFKTQEDALVETIK